jgi:tetratricopeptide (TPR) repeat protein
MPWAIIIGFAALLVAGVIGLPRLRSGVVAPQGPGSGTPGPVRPVTRAASIDADLPPPPPAPLDAVEEAIAIDLPAPGGADAADAEKASELAQRVNQRAEMWGADVQAAEDLLSRHSSDPAMRKLAAAVLYAAAAQERGRRRFAQAIAYLDRATVIDPRNTRIWLGLMVVAQEATDWPRSEAAARSALGLDAGLAEAWYGLGYGLMRQDRNTEAVEALRTAVGIRPDPNTQALLARLTAGMANEKGMTEQQLSHFHVRYDGEEHETVGREILRGLERHFATLTSALDYEPTTTIPVILHSRQSYHREGGFSQALGHFDQLDGRIRVPIQGFTGLSADLDGTLLHELTHAFVNERTRGVAQRFPIQEGLAQYMAGERIASLLTAEQLAWLADGRMGGPQGAYLESLSFVEYVVGTRGMGGMNDLLKAMGETGSQDEAFKQVHGQTLAAMSKAWRQRLRQQHGN